MIIEIPVITYVAKEYDQFLDDLDEISPSEEEYREGDEWKKALASSEERDVSNLIPPRIFIAKALINTEDIILVNEASSIPSVINSPDIPVYDCLEITLDNDIKITCQLSIEEFKKLWK